MVVADEEEEDRLNKVLFSNKYIKNYSFDKNKEMWCNVTLVYPVSHGRLDLSTLLKDLAAKSVIHQVAGIRRAFTNKVEDELVLKTDGLNFAEIFQQDTILNVNKLYSNDVQSVAQTYGIEAAAKVIVREIQDVFKVYGITVDPRHLLLIADYMTFDGTFQPLSRKGIEANSSPLQQMSFESSLAFLKSAVLCAKTDSLSSPSARIMVGQHCKSGTGSFELIHKLDL
uniref:DNA-directed RNA polymerase n=2 Tax=Clastoptera arizonana TaxID=38151 RepID=A0A1B6E2G9_9HEMI